MSLLGNTILDHRDNPCEEFPLRGRLAHAVISSPLPSQVARALRADIAAARPHARWTWSMTILPFLLVGNMIAMTARPGGWTTHWRMWAMMVAVVIGFVVLSGFTRFASLGEAVNPFLARRRCPSCAYDLADTPPDPDGCTTCPECGAAWRILA